MGSSQALGIDVLGTIKVSDERDRIIGAIARRCGVPGEGPWKLKLEWTDPANFLREPEAIQVDAIAFGKNGLLVFECKFAEAGGGCGQPTPIATGIHSGLRQCTGDYLLQPNPLNGRASRCALTGKGVRYWELIPEVFGLDPEQDYRPCPFRDDSYEWMRNVLLAETLAAARGVYGSVVAVYADGNFDTAEKVRSGVLGRPAASGKKLIFPMSYQEIVALAESLSDHPDQWVELGAWIDRKIAAAEAQQGSIGSETTNA